MNNITDEDVEKWLLKIRRYFVNLKSDFNIVKCENDENKTETEIINAYLIQYNYRYGFFAGFVIIDINGFVYVPKNMFDSTNGFKSIRKSSNPITSIFLDPSMENLKIDLKTYYHKYHNIRTKFYIPYLNSKKLRRKGKLYKKLLKNDIFI